LCLVYDKYEKTWKEYYEQDLGMSFKREIYGWILPDDLMCFNRKVIKRITTKEAVNKEPIKDRFSLPKERITKKNEKVS
jgi:hypothetical protein